MSNPTLTDLLREHIERAVKPSLARCHATAIAAAPVTLTGTDRERDTARLLYAQVITDQDMMHEAVEMLGMRPYSDAVLMAAGSKDPATRQDAADAHGLIHQQASRLLALNAFSLACTFEADADEFFSHFTAPEATDD